MNWQKTLQNKYSHIFADNFCFECEEGWFGVIDKMCYQITEYLQKNPSVEKITALQVKEKFGTLRFYYSGGDDFTDVIVREAEKSSAETCEISGGEGCLHKKHGYYKTLNSNVAKLLDFQNLKF